jgi:hypothetical protein
MEFNLFYRGAIKSNSGHDEKHEIRLEFHKQLNLLWTLAPLKFHTDWKQIRENKELNSKIGLNNYVFLVSSNLNMYVELNINFLIPRKTSFQDIDNKLKTLCDALHLPDKNTEASKPRYDIQPILCLLEDDNLIYKLNADTEYLLENTFENNDRTIFKNEHDMITIIGVKIRGNRNIQEYSDLII